MLNVNQYNLEYIIDHYVKINFYKDEYNNIIPMPVIGEQHTITKNTTGEWIVTLAQIPDIDAPITIKNKLNTLSSKPLPFVNYVEVSSLPLTAPNQFYFDKEKYCLYFKDVQENQDVLLNYTAIGRACLSANMLYTEYDSSGNILKFFEELVRESQVALKQIITVGNAESLRMSLESQIKILLDIFNTIKKDVPLAKQLSAELDQKVKEASTVVENITQAVSDATDLANTIKMTGNTTKQITTQMWGEIQSDGYYHYNWEHTMASIDINMTCYTTTASGREQIMIKAIIKDTKHIEFISDENTETIVIATARAWGGVIASLNAFNTDNLVEGIVNKYVTPEQLIQINKISNIDNRTLGISYNLDNFEGVNGNDKLAIAIGFFNGEKGTILISKNYNIIDNINIPSNITLEFKNTGLLIVKSGKKLTVDGNIKAGIFQIFSCSAGDVLLPNLKQEAYPQWFGAKGDRITNDRVAMDGLIYSGCPVVRIPQGEYQAYIGNGYSNRTFIFDEGAIIDGVVHLANGDGIGVNSNATSVTYVENIRVVGTLTSTVRVGTYYCRNVNIDKIRLVPTDSKWVNQTIEGGQKGNHFTSGTENLYIGEQIIEGTGVNSVYGLGIDKYPADSINLPRNINFGTITINNNKAIGITISDAVDISINTININSYDKAANTINNCKNVKIGKVFVNGESATTPNLFGIVFSNVTNLTVDDIISEKSYLGSYVNTCTNVNIRLIKTNNNTNKGAYFYNNTNLKIGSILSYLNGEMGVHFKSSVECDYVRAYDNASSNGIFLDGENGCSNSLIKKIVAYNNRDSNVVIHGLNNRIENILAFNPIGDGFSVVLQATTNCKVDFIETYGAIQGLRLIDNTNVFGRFLYTHDNTTGIAISTSNGTFIDYVKYSTNTIDISGGTINATVITS